MGFWDSSEASRFGMWGLVAARGSRHASMMHPNQLPTTAFVAVALLLLCLADADGRPMSRCSAAHKIGSHYMVPRPTAGRAACSYTQDRRFLLAAHGRASAAAPVDQGPVDQLGVTECAETGPIQSVCSHDGLAHLSTVVELGGPPVIV